MASFLSGENKVKADSNSIRVVPALPIPAYADIAKQANDVCHTHLRKMSFKLNHCSRYLTKTSITSLLVRATCPWLCSPESD